MGRDISGGSHTHQKRAPVVFSIFVLVEKVDDGGQEGVEESKDSNGDKELGRFGKVALQEKCFVSLKITQRHFEMHLFKPDGGEITFGTSECHRKHRNYRVHITKITS